MKLHRRCGAMIVFLAIIGCGSDKQGPTGAVYEGKHVSEWGDIAWESEDSAARLHAAKVLAKLGKEGISGKEAINNLHKTAANAEDPSVRGWAAVALVYAVRGTPFPIGQVAGPVLKEAADSSDEELRDAAKEILGRMPTGGGGGPPGGPGGQRGGKRGAGEGQPGEKKAPTEAPGEKPEKKESPPEEKKSPSDKSKDAPASDAVKPAPPPSKDGEG
ncbi:MAG TPA: HEAT repeat domain-containing protein [Gemmataceae bacterium]|nr:HEAT repeat domain-containing protein [Gemmataceae bacterium]